MTSATPSNILGRVASLHLHPPEPGTAMTKVDAVELVEGMGIRDEPRYFGRRSRRDGSPTRRQVSLIEREQIAEHAAALGLEVIPPGAVRSNIETEGMSVSGLLGHEVQVGEAVIRIDEPRTPCEKMDAICQGLRALMEDHRQGVLAIVVRSGQVHVGDPIRLVSAAR